MCCGIFFNVGIHDHNFVCVYFLYTSVYSKQLDMLKAVFFWEVFSFYLA